MGLDTRVHGKARCYQVSWTGGFICYGGTDPNNIKGTYVDGPSITNGTPHQHTWTFIVGNTNHVFSSAALLNTVMCSTSRY